MTGRRCRASSEAPALTCAGGTCRVLIKSIQPLTLLGFVLCLMPVPAARAQQEPAARLEQDTFMSGAEVRLRDEVLGDAVLVGGSIDVAAPVHGDVVAAGHQLELGGPFRSNLYAAGGRVQLDGDVAGNARLMGGEVTLAPRAAVTGAVSVAAARADVAGSIGRYLQVTAGSTRISGHIAGDVDVSGGDLLLDASAEVDGRVIFRGPEPVSVAPGARVHGDVLHVPGAPVAGPWRRLLDVAAFVSVAALGLAALGLLSGGLWPRFSRSAIAAATSRSGRALLTGLAAAIGGPMVIALLSLSVVGLPLALLAACAYLLSFPLGYVVAAAGVGERLSERTGPAARYGASQRALALLASLFGVGVLAWAPVIGPLSVAALTLIGIGGLVLASVDSIRSRHRAEAPSPEATRSDRAQPPDHGDASLPT